MLARRIERDVKERGRDVDGILEQSVRRPLFRAALVELLSPLPDTFVM